MGSKDYRLINFIELPDFVTMLGIVSGLLAIHQSSVGNFPFSFILLMFCVVFDHFDGKVARWLGKTNRPFGEALDSLGDTTSFLVAPALVGYYLGFSRAPELVLLGLFILTGILRLARFNSIKELENKTIGMPVTYNGLILPLLFFAQVLFGLDLHLSLAAGFIVSTLAMGSTIPLPNI
jgi:CDP-diacylglycerol--serine O-phosphatidyltransferase